MRNLRYRPRYHRILGRRLPQLVLGSWGGWLHRTCYQMVESCKCKISKSFLEMNFWLRILTLIDQRVAAAVVALEESVYSGNQISLGPNWSFFSQSRENDSSSLSLSSVSFPLSSTFFPVLLLKTIQFFFNSNERFFFYWSSSIGNSALAHPLTCLCNHFTVHTCTRHYTVCTIKYYPSTKRMETCFVLFRKKT